MPQLNTTTPIGPLAIAEEDGEIVSVDWGWAPESVETPLLVRARDQLEAYFDGSCKAFDLPLRPMGTAYQRRVWQAIAAIPFGQVRSYGAIARELGTAPRALGGACGRNPIPIFIPCHRVLAGDRSLGGYSGMDGLDTKRFLLNLEGVL